MLRRLLGEFERFGRRWSVLWFEWRLLVDRESLWQEMLDILNVKVHQLHVGREQALGNPSPSAAG